MAQAIKGGRLCPPVSFWTCVPCRCWTFLTVLPWAAVLCIPCQRQLGECCLSTAENARWGWTYPRHHVQMARVSNITAHAGFHHRGLCQQDAGGIGLTGHCIGVTLGVIEDTPVSQRSWKFPPPVVESMEANTRRSGCGPHGDLPKTNVVSAHADPQKPRNGIVIHLLLR